MHISETWSISAERVRYFFSRQGSDACQIENDIFSYGLCKILITPLPPRQVGILCFPQTMVEFIGPEPDITYIHRRFVLQFISAGG
ncbi:MAG: hypothetical protein K5771_03410 [Oscillospiraceae bacterium]|nr:hypothetical protein [Oscillospiraceae bacterium]